MPVPLYDTCRRINEFLERKHKEVAMTKYKEKTVDIGRSEDDMLPKRGQRAAKASQQMKAKKKKPGAFKPGAKPSEGGRRG